MTVMTELTMIQDFDDGFVSLPLFKFLQTLHFLAFIGYFLSKINCPRFGFMYSFLLLPNFALFQTFTSSSCF